MADVEKHKELILASGSRIRRSLLQSAGISFTVAPADLDESAIRNQMKSKPGSTEPSDVAAALASAKAKAISRENPDALVIGADQILALGERVYEKPKDITTARENLMALRAQTHQLYSAVALGESGEIVWSEVARADLMVRAFSDEFLDEYLARLGDGALESVGGYHLEGLGIQLFDHIEGDYFTVLGLPMLPLIKELRHRKVVLA